MKSKQLVYTFILFVSILLTACSQKTPIIETAEFDKIESAFLESLDGENIIAALEELAKEPRVSGTGSEQQAAAFLTSQLENFGYAVEEQPFNFKRYTFPDSIEITIDDFDDKLSPAAFQFTVAGHVSGEIVEAGLGLPPDYNDLDVDGKIVLVAADHTSFDVLLRNADEAGAAAILIYFPLGYPIDRWSLGTYDDAFIPALALSHEDGKKLREHMTNNHTVNATMTIEGARIEVAQSQNLIVKKMPNPEIDASDDIVSIGAHYDSVDHAPGASDNASGTAVVLELARALKDAPTTKEIRFLFFGAEEIGLVGSEYYVSTLAKKEIKRSIAMFNLDMVGSSDAGELAIQTADGMENAVTKIASKAHEQLNGNSIKVNLGARSDHTPFHKAGIDAALFIYYPPEDWYHSTDDTIDNISKERLLNVAKIVGKSTLELTTSSSGAN